MQLIQNNPYRVLGLPITATEREIAKQINTLATYAEMGKTKSLETDFPFLSLIDRTPHTIEEAKKQIEQSESKLLYSLFWFWKNNSADELAFEVLKEGNIDKAIYIWSKSIFSNKNKLYKPVIFIENLIKHSISWSEISDEVHILKKNIDEYIIERKKESGSSIPTVYADINDDENWTIDCDTVWLEGVDNNSYGIIFGREKGSYFSFNISGNGFYCLGKTTESTYDELIAWKECNAINLRSSNHIQIKKLNYILYFYINSELVDSITYQPFFGKKFGFKINNNQKVSFRNFKFCKLVEYENYGEGINVSSKNFSNIKNLSTLYLSLATNNGALQLDYFNKGIALAKNFFSANNIEEYSKLIAGDRYIYNSEKALHFYINQVIDSLKKFIEVNGGISTSQLINSFSDFPVEAIQFLNDRFVSKQIQNIDKEIVMAQTERKKSAANAIGIGKNLVTNTKEDISFLKNVLSENNFQYQIICDKLSLAIVQCGIDAFNYYKDSSGEIDYPKAIKSEEVYLLEYEYAMQIAVTERARERASENLCSCYIFILDRDIDEAHQKRKQIPFEALNTGKNLILKTKQNIFSLKKSLGEFDEKYRTIIDRLVFAVVQCGIDYFNTTKNDEPCLPLYEFGVANAISEERKIWAKENLDSCKEWISTKNIRGLKFTPDIQSRYVSPTTYSNQNNSQSSFSDKYCYIATMVYGSYDAPQVLILRRFRDEFLEKYLFGRYFIKFYYANSPKLVKRLKNSKFANSVIKFILDTFIKILQK